MSASAVARGGGAAQRQHSLRAIVSGRFRVGDAVSQRLVARSSVATHAPRQVPVLPPGRRGHIPPRTRASRGTWMLAPEAHGTISRSAPASPSARARRAGFGAVAAGAWGAVQVAWPLPAPRPLHGAPREPGPAALPQVGIGGPLTTPSSAARARVAASSHGVCRGGVHRTRGTPVLPRPPRARERGGGVRGGGERAPSGRRGRRHRSSGDSAWRRGSAPTRGGALGATLGARCVGRARTLDTDPQPTGQCC